MIWFNSINAARVLEGNSDLCFKLFISFNNSFMGLSLFKSNTKMLVLSSHDIGDNKYSINGNNIILTNNEEILLDTTIISTIMKYAIMYISDMEEDTFNKIKEQIENELITISKIESKLEYPLTVKELKEAFKSIDNVIKHTTLLG